MLDWLGAPWRKPEVVRGRDHGKHSRDSMTGWPLWCGIWEMTSYWMRAPRRRCQLFRPCHLPYGRAKHVAISLRGDFRIIGTILSMVLRVVLRIEVA